MLPTDFKILNSYQKRCYLLFGKFTKLAARKNYALRAALEQSHMGILAEAYLATVWMSVVIATVLSLVLLVMLDFVLLPKMLGSSSMSMILTVLIDIGIFAIPVCVYFFVMNIPFQKAASRKKDIDSHLPYASNFIAALSASNATPTAIFKSLSFQKSIYGEVSEEALWIYRDTVVLGIDLLTTLKMAVNRSPSVKFKEFLQGIVGVLTSGGSLRNYFLNRAEFFMRENRREQQDFIDTLAFMAESYVVVAVAMPMFLMIIMVITAWVSPPGSGFGGTTMLYMITFLMLPVLHLGYIASVFASTPKI
jgi:flagellar protein FlaJ